MMSADNFYFHNNENTDKNIDIEQINKDKINQEAATYYYDTILDFIFNYKTKEETQKPSETRKPIFNVVYYKRDNLFTETKDDLPILFTTIKRSAKKKRRMENRDNIRRKIKRSFLNIALIKKLNEKLNDIGCISFFQKFPKSFVSDITRKTNKDILNMTLREIFEKKELYSAEELDHYNYNLNVLKNEIIKENEGINIILNKKYFELYKEYINSKEFKIDTINRLKEKKMDNSYIEKYKYFAKNFLEFFED